MRKAIAGAITLTTLTVAVNRADATAAPIMPPSLLAGHVVNLMTNEGSGAFGVQWRVADVRIVEGPAAINKDRYKTTRLPCHYQHPDPYPAGARAICQMRVSPLRTPR